ncbi:MAG: glycogen debranching protein GlgX [Alphaproteobacteria bacterium]
MQIKREWAIEAGKPDRLGATPRDGGVNFTLFSDHADKVELCLFDAAERQVACLPMIRGKDGLWTGFVKGAKPGLRYGYRVHGPDDPGQGHVFNPDKLLIDPAARRLTRAVGWHKLNFGHAAGDNAAHQVKGIVTAPVKPDWKRPKRPWADTVIYEAHAKGATAQHMGIHRRRRGTLEGLSDPAMIAHMKKAGVTAVEVLPLMAWADETHLVKAGLTNYWGYNPVNFFAIDPRRGTPEQMRRMVSRLHDAGIEVILDVVYNHSGEGGADGPMHSLRGIDNRSYYRSKPDNPAEYEDFTGCGNTLNLEHPQVTRMVVESLRHWVEELGVDGFRFDLAATLGRSADPGQRSRLLRAIEADPVLKQVKLIAEPWDIGPDGYHLGRFGKPWAEWNDSFRDTVRKYWRGDKGMLAGFATAMAGSKDKFPGRTGPQASINFITAHDGFTMADLVSYRDKHNHANKEGNRDGGNHNESDNYGVEGKTADKAIIETRARQRRNMLATLFLAQGVPMLLAGDEFGNAQKGNNNAYCQDNAIAHLDWYRADGEERDFKRFAYRLADIRKRFHQFRRQGWLTGRPMGKGMLRDVSWFSPSGRQMSLQDWKGPHHRAMAMHLADKAGTSHMMTLFNAHDGPVTFTLPRADHGATWHLLADTQDPHLPEGARNWAAGSKVTLQGRSTLVITTQPPKPALKPDRKRVLAHAGLQVAHRPKP